MSQRKPKGARQQAARYARGFKGERWGIRRGTHRPAGPPGWPSGRAWLWPGRSPSPWCTGASCRSRTRTQHFSSTVDSNQRAFIRITGRMYLSTYLHVHAHSSQGTHVGFIVPEDIDHWRKTNLTPFVNNHRRQGAKSFCWLANMR